MIASLQKVISSNLIVATLSINQCLLGEEVEKAESSPSDYRVCSPIAVPPNSALAAIQSRILGNSDFELAIFLRGDTAFEAIVLWEKPNGFQCDSRVIHFKDVYSDKGLDKDLISACEVHVKSEPIDKNMVAILRETLKNQIEKATYKVDQDFKWANFLGGSVFNVYTKGGEDDTFQYYAAKFFIPKVQGSYSCDSIYLALRIFATNENADFRAVPLTNLTNYLIDMKEGRNPATDPSFNEPIPDPELEVPPP